MTTYSAAQSDFGFLTLATPRDYTKAIALALSLRVSNPGIPIAVACQQELANDPKLRPTLNRVFDFVRVQDARLRGFEHKVHLDEYSPFETTLYLDSDILVFRNVKQFIVHWPLSPYTACGTFLNTGRSSFGFDRATALARLRKAHFVCIDGAGHALFRKPGCIPLFERAREITRSYADYGGGAVYADEDVMNYVMTEQDLPPATPGEFFSRFMSGRTGTVRMDAANGKCSYVSTDTGLSAQPCIMHFAAREAPLHYGWQMWKLYRSAGLPPRGLLRSVASDVWQWHFKRRLRDVKVGLLSRMRARRVAAAQV